MGFNYEGIRDQTVKDTVDDIKKIMRENNLEFLEAGLVYRAAQFEDAISDLFLDEKIGFGEMVNNFTEVKLLLRQIREKII